MPVKPRDAGPHWPGWDDVIKARSEMCEAKAGEEKFIEYLDELFGRPRKWEPNAAHGVAMRLRSAPRGLAFPLGDIITVLDGCPGSRVIASHKGTKITQNQLGHNLRNAGVVLVLPTRHLNGTYSASAVGANRCATTIAKALALVRTAADQLGGLPPAEVLDALDDKMRKQFAEFGDDVVAPVNNMLKLLKEGD